MPPVCSRLTQPSDSKIPNMRFPTTSAETSDAILDGELARLAPSSVGQHLVIRSYPQGCAITQVKPNHLLLALVHTAKDGTDVELAEFVGGDDRGSRSGIDDVLDAIGQSGHRIEDRGTSRHTFILDDLHPGPVSNDFHAIF